VNVPPVTVAAAVIVTKGIETELRLSQVAATTPDEMRLARVVTASVGITRPDVLRSTSL
jgi:hypothetical protein